MLGGIRGGRCDIDGVLEYKGQVYPGAIDAVETFRRMGFIPRFLTNSTLHSRQSRAARLRAAGFHIFAGEVITASYATAATSSAGIPGRVGSC
jgi:ribonucleotide monophosphatase NagD (HAD superfamily)